MLPIEVSWKGLRSRLSLCAGETEGTLSMALFARASFAWGPSPSRPKSVGAAHVSLMAGWQPRRGRRAVTTTLVPGQSEDIYGYGCGLIAHYNASLAASLRTA